MLCRSCLRAAVGRQAVPSAPLRTSSTSVRIPSLPALPRISRRKPSSAASTVAGHGSLSTRSLAPRFYSTSTSAEPQQPSTTESSASAAAAAAASPLEKPDFLDEAESTIWDLLAAELDPQELVVRDISGGCGSMYGIEISSDKFRGANMLKQQRMVNAVLGDLMKGWHGVQLKTRVP